MWQHLSRDRKGVREGVTWVSRGRAFEEEGTASAKVLGQDGSGLLEEQQEAGEAEAE